VIHGHSEGGCDAEGAGGGEAFAVEVVEFGHLKGKMAMVA
jgi:hypothetical protein